MKILRNLGFNEIWTFDDGIKLEQVNYPAQWLNYF